MLAWVRLILSPSPNSAGLHLRSTPTDPYQQLLKRSVFKSWLPISPSLSASHLQQQPIRHTQHHQLSMSANNSGHDDSVGPRDIDVLTSLAFTNTTTAEDKIDKEIDEKGATVNVKEASSLDDDRKLYGDAMDGEVEGIAWTHDGAQAAAGTLLPSYPS